MAAVAPPCTIRPLPAGGVIIALAGRLDEDAVAAAWGPALEAIRANEAGRIEVDCSQVTYCGGAGLALLTALREHARSGQVTVEGLDHRFEELLGAIDTSALEPEPVQHGPQMNAVARLGRLSDGFFQMTRAEVAFLGEASVALWAALWMPWKVRWSDVWSTVTKAGTSALPIVCLIGFLMGLIMAFQSAIPMRQFGADLFAINIVALATLRELGPIMTAVVLAGRSGSAFAAEIGTMKINEEINALSTMGLDPVRFLAVPRMIAGIAVTPVLTIYANLLGVLGGLFVMMAMGFSWAALVNQLASAVSYKDLLSGLIKAFFFGAVVSGVGCMRGLQTKNGAAAVGDSTTSSVVTSIFLIVVLDALFAVVFYAIKF